MEEKLLDEWQERLGLQDWVIALRYNCEFEDLETENSCGETEWLTSIKTATIRIVKEELCGGRTLDFDFEKILVHELLHIKFALIDQEVNTYESKVAEQVRHQLIDDLARALILAKRGETKRQMAKDCKRIKDMSKTDEESLELRQSFSDTFNKGLESISKQTEEAYRKFITERS